MPRDPTSPNPPDPAPPRRTDSARRTPPRTPPRTLSHTPSLARPLGVAVTPIDPLQVLVDTRRPLPPHCPRCGGAPLIRWGTFSGRQRYRCKACGRTSSDLTGTALAYTKKLPLWGEFAAGMLEGESCRQGARRLGIHKDTAWRWRHRLLERLLATPEPPLSGTTELIEARVLVCRKGERGLPRPALRRGRPFPLLPRLGGRPAQPEATPAGACTPARGLAATGRTPVAHETATLLLAYDRQQQSRAALLWRADAPGIQELLNLLGLHPRPPQAARPDPASTILARNGSPEGDAATLRLLSRGRRHSAYTELARRYGLYHRRVSFSAPGPPTWARGAREPVRRAEHLGTASSALRRLRTWLRRFRGVATKYLLRYWAWHRFLDAMTAARAVRRLLAGAGRRDP